MGWLFKSTWISIHLSLILILMISTTVPDIWRVEIIVPSWHALTQRNPFSFCVIRIIWSDLAHLEHIWLLNFRLYTVCFIVEEYVYVWWYINCTLYNIYKIYWLHVRVRVSIIFLYIKFWAGNVKGTHDFAKPLQLFFPGAILSG